MCTINVTVLWVMVPELISLELMSYLVTRSDLAWDHVKMETQNRGAALTENIHPLDLCIINIQAMSNATRNIYSAWDDLLDHLGRYSWPYDDELLPE